MLVESKCHNHETVYHKYISQVKLNNVVATHMRVGSAFNVFFRDRAWARSAFNVTPTKFSKLVEYKNKPAAADTLCKRFACADAEHLELSQKLQM